MRKAIGSAAILLAKLTASCPTDPTTSGEYAELEQQFTEVTAERDALLADRRKATTR